MELSITTILGLLTFSLSVFGILEELMYILTTFKAFLTAFIVFYLTISIFLSLVEKNSYMPFNVYRLVLGITLLWLI